MVAYEAVYLVFFNRTLIPATPATLPNKPIQNSDTKPFSKLQCTVNGAQARFETMSFLHLASHSVSSRSVMTSPLGPSVLFSSAVPLLALRTVSRYNLTKLRATCVIQNREL